MEMYMEGIEPGKSLRPRPAGVMVAAVMATALSATSAGGQQAPAAEAAAPTLPAPGSSGYVEANGVRYHYTVWGEGEPLLLLHGGLGTKEMFAPILPMLGEGRQVIGVDLHGHGRTALGDRPIRLEDMGDDMASILEHLGHDEVDVVGYSMGGGVGLRLAVQHPEKVRRLVVVSAGYARDGFFPEILEQQAQVGAAAAEFMEDTPMYEAYAAVAPHPGDFPRLLDRMGELMAEPYDWSGDVRGLEMPVMLIYADGDMFRPEHMVSFYQLLGGGLRDAGWMREHLSQNRLAILPNVTHYDIFASPAMAATARSFLDGEGGR